MTIKVKIAILLSCLVLISCGKPKVFDEYVSVGTSWNEKTEVKLSFEAPDTISKYNMFIQLRNNRNYPFSNIFLIVQTETPDKNIEIDTLEYAMTKPDGTFLGTGFSDLKENKLFFREKTSFKKLGTYNMRIRHAVRKIGSVEGVGNLEGITDVGLIIENIDN